MIQLFGAYLLISFWLLFFIIIYAALRKEKSKMWLIIYVWSISFPSTNELNNSSAICMPSRCFCCAVKLLIALKKNNNTALTELTKTRSLNIYQAIEAHRSSLVSLRVHVMVNAIARREWRWNITWSTASSSSSFLSCSSCSHLCLQSEANKCAPACMENVSAPTLP